MLRGLIAREWNLVTFLAYPNVIRPPLHNNPTFTLTDVRPNLKNTPPPPSAWCQALGYLAQHLDHRPHPWHIRNLAPWPH